MEEKELFKQLDEEMKKTVVLEKDFKDEVLSKELERLLDIRDYINKRIDEVQQERSNLLSITLSRLESLNKEV